LVIRDPFKGCSPRYAAYCVAHGLTPAAYPTPRQIRPFVYWIGHELDLWCKALGIARHALGFAEHRAFDEWLAQKYPRPIRKRAYA
jgi:hypothetical protein